jgi:hypothetical protein
MQAFIRVIFLESSYSVNTGYDDSYWHLVESKESVRAGLIESHALRHTFAIYPLKDRGWLRNDARSMICRFNSDGQAYCSFAYSALASFKTGTSGSASFQAPKKS